MQAARRVWPKSIEAMDRVHKAFPNMTTEQRETISNLVLVAIEEALNRPIPSFWDYMAETILRMDR